MRMLVYLVELSKGIVRVHLCSGQRGMPQQCLKRFQTGTVIQHVRSEGMPQDVRATFVQMR